MELLSGNPVPILAGPAGIVLLKNFVFLFKKYRHTFKIQIQIDERTSILDIPYR